MKKWRNKITGEINEFMIHKRIEDSEDGNPVYAPFDGDIDEWEDYNEEPKEYWYISDFGYVLNHEINNKSVKSTIEEMKLIGNYFNTREEAEKAVEKLKAFKRLKDKGFRFTGYTHKDRGRLDELEIYCQLGECPENIEEMDDVHLLFGGEK